MLVQEWLARPGCRIKVHYIPSYCPHLDPIERLWGLMHRRVTHNRCYATYNDFCRSVLHFLREQVSKNWAVFCDSVTDNFRAQFKGPGNLPGRKESSSMNLGIT